MLKDVMWRATFATIVPEFRRSMEALKALDGEAYRWLTAAERPPRHWSRSHFNTNLKCPILLNNLCESFNSWIMSARCKPIISMMEEIRVKMMRMIQMRRDLMMTWERPICPRPLGKLETSKKNVAACIAIMSGGPKFQVDTVTGGQFIVDLDERTYSCRNWDLSGVPCNHALSTINHKRGDMPESYVDKCYMKETFLKIYGNIIQHVNGMDLWERIDWPEILPPRYNRQPGRPIKVRRKEATEKDTKIGGKKLGRYQDSLKCGTCRQKGHNSKTCHRHKPSSDRNLPAISSKRAKVAVGTSIPTSTPDNYEAEMERKNKLREKAKQRAKVLKEKRDKKKAKAVASSGVDSSNLTGVVRKRAKRSNTRCTNYASTQESQT